MMENKDEKYRSESSSMGSENVATDATVDANAQDPRDQNKVLDSSHAGHATNTSQDGSADTSVDEGNEHTIDGTIQDNMDDASWIYDPSEDHNDNDNDPECEEVEPAIHQWNMRRRILSHSKTNNSSKSHKSSKHDNVRDQDHQYHPKSSKSTKTADGHITVGHNQAGGHHHYVTTAKSATSTTASAKFTTIAKSTKDAKSMVLLALMVNEVLAVVLLALLAVVT